MTLNALVSACNQRNNRDPVTNYVEFEVDGALRSLFEKKWITYVEGSGRVRKWKHRVDERLGLTPPELAVLAELLLRGPQHPGELRTRSERMANIPTPEAVLEILDGFGKRMPPLVVKLPRRSGERAERYGQTLAPDGEQSARTAPPALEAPDRQQPPSQPTSPSETPLAARIERLERELAVLRAEVESLKGRAASNP
jgi:uncharacterized protein YceH (UPF0502 family)